MALRFHRPNRVEERETSENVEVRRVPETLLLWHVPQYGQMPYRFSALKRGRVPNSWLLTPVSLRLLLNLYFFLGDNGRDILKSLILTKIH